MPHWSNPVVYLLLPPSAMRGLRCLPGLCILILLTACAGESPSPEAQLRAVIEAGEVAVESRDLGATMELVDPDYRDSRQRDWHQLRGLVAGYFFRHPSIYIIGKIEGIEFIQPERAKVVMFAGLAGSPQEAAGPLAGWRGNLLRLELEFKQQAGETWRLQSADWRPATREDFAL